MRRLPTLRGFVCCILFLFTVLHFHRGFAATILRDKYGEQPLPDQQMIGNRFQTFMDLVRSSGYTAEEHDVTTEDGYILSVHRIPGGPKSPVMPGKPTVILIHGLFAASDIWVLRGPGKDLAYLLCDEGYDVWLLNTRGNFYGKRHKRLTPKESKFWRFSWHEFGVYDTAATIDHVLKSTGLEKVSLIGHSMGCSIELVLLSMKPEYNNKVNVVLSFAPVAIFTHSLPGLASTIGIRYGKQIQETLQLLGMSEILPRNTAIMGIYSSLCEDPRIEYFCQKLIFNFLGLTNPEHFTISIIHILLQHFPQGTSIETLIHYRQIIISGKFTQYDFGPGGNFLHYKNITPPEYNLAKITTPVVLYYGSNDAYTTEQDVMALRSRLPNATSREVPFEMFSHLDFIFSNHSKRLLYNDVIGVLGNYADDRINETQP